MIVMKFGGSSVGNAERIRNVSEIIKSNRSRNPAVVVSAVGGITDRIINAAKNAAENKGESEGAREITEHHYRIIRELGLNEKIISKEAEEFIGLFENLSQSRILTPRISDRIVSFGERMSARILASYLVQSGIDAGAYDAYDLGLLTDSNFGNADIMPETYSKINDAFKDIYVMPVITGFIGKDKNGEITTLGRGGSDYTASIFGAALGASEIQIWTDVNGIMTADPKVVSGVQSISVVSFDEASELAALGAKVIHPKTVLPALERNIRVRILNTFEPTHSGTEVLKEIPSGSRVVSVTSKKGVTIARAHSTDNHNHTFLGLVSAALDKCNASANIISASRTDAAIAFSDKEGADKVLEEIGKIADVAPRTKMAIVSLVGNNIASLPNLFGRVFSSLDGINIEMVLSGASGMSQSVIVEEKDADETVRLLHEQFFGI